ncbi:MAG TPA: malonyl-CoA decarboxylase, partial [Kiloniellales bacterium]|nr:malonyl-CoA decarboxylase [Kiloniellales bacterium]
AEPPQPDTLAALKALMRECLEARGGEVSARLRAAELGEAYLRLSAADRRRFLEMLARDFACDPAVVAASVAQWQTATGEERVTAEEALRRALVPPRVRLVTQFTTLPAGVKFVVDLRADLLAIKDPAPELRALDRDIRGLLENWFDVGFLDVRRISWDSPASLLEKLIAYEAVHEIRSWNDLRHRLDSDRRLYGLFHPRMPEEPLAFVEVALVEHLADNVQELLDVDGGRLDAEEARVAIFYSISNTQKGLQGIAFGEWLIKRVVVRLSEELANIDTFATLSPLPGFRAWLEARDSKTLARQLSEAEQGGLRALGGVDDLAEALQAVLGNPAWHEDVTTATALEAPMKRLALAYLMETRPDGQAVDAVARFHLRNGARLERINWLADLSPNGLKQSAGVMANYLYDLGAMDANHEAYVQEGRVALGQEARALARQLKGEEPARRRA